MGNKQNSGKDKFSKDDRKQLLFVLQLPSNKDHITKDEWFKVVLERGLTQSLGEAIWNTLSNGCNVVEKETFLVALESCILGNETEKLQMSFKFFDIEREDQLTADGIASVFEICYLYEQCKQNTEAKLTEDDKFQINYMTTLIFQEAGISRDEKMTQAVFSEVSTKNQVVGKMFRIF